MLLYEDVREAVGMRIIVFVVIPMVLSIVVLRGNYLKIFGILEIYDDRIKTENGKNVIVDAEETVETSPPKVSLCSGFLPTIKSRRNVL